MFFLKNRVSQKVVFRIVSEMKTEMPVLVAITLLVSAAGEIS